MAKIVKFILVLRQVIFNSLTGSFRNVLFVVLNAYTRLRPRIIHNHVNFFEIIIFSESFAAMRTFVVAFCLVHGRDMAFKISRCAES